MSSTVRKSSLKRDSLSLSARTPSRGRARSQSRSSVDPSVSLSVTRRRRKSRSRQDSLSVFRDGDSVSLAELSSGSDGSSLLSGSLEQFTTSADERRQANQVADEWCLVDTSITAWLRHSPTTDELLNVSHRQGDALRQYESHSLVWVRLKCKANDSAVGNGDAVSDHMSAMSDSSSAGSRQPVAVSFCWWPATVIQQLPALCHCRHSQQPIHSDSVPKSVSVTSQQCSTDKHYNDSANSIASTAQRSDSITVDETSDGIMSAATMPPLTAASESERSAAHSRKSPLSECSTDFEMASASLFPTDRILRSDSILESSVKIEECDYCRKMGRSRVRVELEISAELKKDLRSIERVKPETVFAAAFPKQLNLDKTQENSAEREKEASKSKSKKKRVVMRKIRRIVNAEQRAAEESQLAKEKKRQRKLAIEMANVLNALIEYTLQRMNDSANTTQYTALSQRRIPAAAVDDDGDSVAIDALLSDMKSSTGCSSQRQSADGRSANGVGIGDGIGIENEDRCALFSRVFEKKDVLPYSALYSQVSLKVLKWLLKQHSHVVNPDTKSSARRSNIPIAALTEQCAVDDIQSRMFGLSVHNLHFTLLADLLEALAQFDQTGGRLATTVRNCEGVPLFGLTKKRVKKYKAIVEQCKALRRTVQSFETGFEASVVAKAKSVSCEKGKSTSALPLLSLKKTEDLCMSYLLQCILVDANVAIKGGTATPSSMHSCVSEYFMNRVTLPREWKRTVMQLRSSQVPTEKQMQSTKWGELTNCQLPASFRIAAAIPNANDSGALNDCSDTVEASIGAADTGANGGIEQMSCSLYAGMCVAVFSTGIPHWLSLKRSSQQVLNQYPATFKDDAILSRLLPECVDVFGRRKPICESMRDILDVIQHMWWPAVVLQSSSTAVRMSAIAPEQEITDDFGALTDDSSVSVVGGSSVGVNGQGQGYVLVHLLGLGIDAWYECENVLLWPAALGKSKAKTKRSSKFVRHLTRALPTDILLRENSRTALFKVCSFWFKHAFCCPLLGASKKEPTVKSSGTRTGVCGRFGRRFVPVLLDAVLKSRPCLKGARFDRNYAQMGDDFGIYSVVGRGNGDDTDDDEEEDEILDVNATDLPKEQKQIEAVAKSGMHEEDSVSVVGDSEAAKSQQWTKLQLEKTTAALKEAGDLWKCEDVALARNLAAHMEMQRSLMQSMVGGTLSFHQLRSILYSTRSNVWQLLVRQLKLKLKQGQKQQSNQMGSVSGFKSKLRLTQCSFELMPAMNESKKMSLAVRRRNDSFVVGSSFAFEHLSFNPWQNAFFSQTKLDCHKSLTSEGTFARDLVRFHMPSVPSATNSCVPGVWSAHYFASVARSNRVTGWRWRVSWILRQTLRLHKQLSCRRPLVDARDFGKKSKRRKSERIIDDSIALFVLCSKELSRFPTVAEFVIKALLHLIRKCCAGFELWRVRAALMRRLFAAVNAFRLGFKSRAIKDKLKASRLRERNLFDKLKKAGEKGNSREQLHKMLLSLNRSSVHSTVSLLSGDSPMTARKNSGTVDSIAKAPYFSCNREMILNRFLHRLNEFLYGEQLYEQLYTAMAMAKEGAVNKKKRKEARKSSALMNGSSSDVNLFATQSALTDDSALVNTSTTSTTTTTTSSASSPMSATPGACSSVSGETSDGSMMHFARSRRRRTRQQLLDAKTIDELLKHLEKRAAISKRSKRKKDILPFAETTDYLMLRALLTMQRAVVRNREVVKEQSAKVILATAVATETAKTTAKVDATGVVLTGESLLVSVESPTSGGGMSSDLQTSSSTQRTMLSDTGATLKSPVDSTTSRVSQSSPIESISTMFSPVVSRKRKRTAMESDNSDVVEAVSGSDEVGISCEKETVAEDSSIPTAKRRRKQLSEKKKWKAVNEIVVANNDSEDTDSDVAAFSSAAVESIHGGDDKDAYAGESEGVSLSSASSSRSRRGKKRKSKKALRRDANRRRKRKRRVFGYDTNSSDDLMSDASSLSRHSSLSTTQSVAVSVSDCHSGFNDEMSCTPVNPTFGTLRRHRQKLKERQQSQSAKTVDETTTTTVAASNSGQLSEAQRSTINLESPLSQQSFSSVTTVNSRGTSDASTLSVHSSVASSRRLLTDSMRVAEVGRGKKTGDGEMTGVFVQQTEVLRQPLKALGKVVGTIELLMRKNPWNVAIVTALLRVFAEMKKLVSSIVVGGMSQDARRRRVLQPHFECVYKLLCSFVQCNPLCVLPRLQLLHFTVMHWPLFARRQCLQRASNRGRNRRRVGHQNSDSMDRFAVDSEAEDVMMASPMAGMQLQHDSGIDSDVGGSGGFVGFGFSGDSKRRRMVGLFEGVVADFESLSELRLLCSEWPPVNKAITQLLSRIENGGLNSSLEADTKTSLRLRLCATRVRMLMSTMEHCSCQLTTDSKALHFLANTGWPLLCQYTGELHTLADKFIGPPLEAREETESRRKRICLLREWLQPFASFLKMAIPLWTATFLRYEHYDKRSNALFSVVHCGNANCCVRRYEADIMLHSRVEALVRSAHQLLHFKRVLRVAITLFGKTDARIEKSVGHLVEGLSFLTRALKSKMSALASMPPQFKAAHECVSECVSALIPFNLGIVPLTTFVFANAKQRTTDKALIIAPHCDGASAIALMQPVLCSTAYFSKFNPFPDLALLSATQKGGVPLRPMQWLKAKDEILFIPVYETEKAQAKDANEGIEAKQPKLRAWNRRCTGFRRFGNRHSLKSFDCCNPTVAVNRAHLDTFGRQLKDEVSACFPAVKCAPAPTLVIHSVLRNAGVPV